MGGPTISEMSMISKDFFALLARNIAIGKGDAKDRFFGGISVIILEDFHQFHYRGAQVEKQSDCCQ